MDQLPDDHRCPSPCSFWAELGYCNSYWPEHCGPATKGLVKDYCRLSCKTCGKSLAMSQINLKLFLYNVFHL